MEDRKEAEVKAVSPMVIDEATRKRNRKSVRRTPTLISAQSSVVDADDTLGLKEPPPKRRRGENDQSIPVLQEEVGKEEKRNPTCPLAQLPEDVLAHCLSFCSGVEDRFALQCTSQQFRRISNSDEMMIGIQVGGDKKTGLHGIILETDTPESSACNLLPYARAGNLEAIYMYVFPLYCSLFHLLVMSIHSPDHIFNYFFRLGIIKSYCNQDVEGGIALLRMASDQGYVRASYALGLVLRDTHVGEAASYMKIAADAGYIPALQETLSARTMKAKYGEPQADELRHYLDPLCLNRLLARHYVRAAGLRDLNTSHCWNPLCGRWAFKATMNMTQQTTRHRRHAAHRWAAARQYFGLGGSTATSSRDNTETSDTNEAHSPHDIRVSRMKMCSRCCRAKYCSKLCQVYDWRSGRHKMECQFL